MSTFSSVTLLSLSLTRLGAWWRHAAFVASWNRNLSSTLEKRQENDCSALHNDSLLVIPRTEELRAEETLQAAFTDSTPKRICFSVKVNFSPPNLNSNW